MTYDIVTIRSGDDGDDDRLYPALSELGAATPFLMSPDDGQPRQLTAKAMYVRRSSEGRIRDVVDLPDRVVEVCVTDSRVVITCEKYDIGARWSGFGAGAALAVAANGVSRAVAAHRRRGKLLVGHVRYPWLARVGGSPKLGWLESNQLRVTVQPPAGEGDWLFLDLTFEKRVDVLDLAADITRRCAAHRLAHDSSIADEERESLTDLTVATPLPARPKKFALHVMPTSYRAVERTASYPSPR